MVDQGNHREVLELETDYSPLVIYIIEKEIVFIKYISNYKIKIDKFIC